MKKAWILAAGVAMLSASFAHAEGVPSESKLSQLGLSSMNVAADEAGLQVRGKGFGGLQISYFLQAVDPTGTGTTAILGTPAPAGGVITPVNIVATYGSAPRSVGAVVGADLGFGIAQPDATTGLASGAATANFISTPLAVRTIVNGVVTAESVIGGFVTARSR